MDPQFLSNLCPGASFHAGSLLKGTVYDKSFWCYLLKPSQTSPMMSS